MVPQAEFLVHPAAGAWSVHGTDKVKLSPVTLRSNGHCSMAISTICAKASKESLLAKYIKVSIYVNCGAGKHRSLPKQRQRT